jgi:hypothetical protein
MARGSVTGGRRSSGSGGGGGVTGGTGGASRGGSVKVKRPLPQGNKVMNDNASEIAKLRKSGEFAKRSEKNVVTKKMGTIKINSAPAKSADAAKSRADAKALKAANKKKK